MRFEFLELPGQHPELLLRPVVPVQLEDLVNAPQLCLIDTGASTNRFAGWLAEATGIDLAGAPESSIVVGGIETTARHARADLTIGDVRYDAPISFCDPWPLGFSLLGQEGFLRYFRLTLCAAEGWLELEREPAG